MGTPQTTELIVRALLADRERSVVEASRLSRDLTPVCRGSGRLAVLRLGVGRRLIRLGVRIAGTNLGPVAAARSSPAFPS
ncbi:MAG TPA: hypothetical protein VER37_05525 [Thermomicrobiales bacterium]|nr:hypothetical protein [Thermomicrobiales bacterium]